MANLDMALTDLAETEKREREQFTPVNKITLGGPDPDDYS